MTVRPSLVVERVYGPGLYGGWEAKDLWWERTRNVMCVRHDDAFVPVADAGSSAEGSLAYQIARGEGDVQAMKAERRATFEPFTLADVFRITE